MEEQKPQLDRICEAVLARLVVGERMRQVRLGWRLGGLTVSERRINQLLRLGMVAFDRSCCLAITRAGRAWMTLEKLAARKRDRERVRRRRQEAA